MDRALTASFQFWKAGLDTLLKFLVVLFLRPFLQCMFAFFLDESIVLVDFGFW